MSKSVAAPMENKMGVMPVGKLLLNMGVPIMLSMLVQALYNVVDSIFVSRISEAALTAVSMAFPMQNLIISFATGIGVGMNALLSRALGQRDQKTANKMAVHGLFLVACCAVCFLIAGVFFSRAYMNAQTTDPEIFRHGVSYLTICCIRSFAIFGEIIFERMLQATGRTLLSMVSQMTGAVINLIFDPIMIFGLLGCPRMGVTGAALATVLGQIVACILAFVLNQRKNPEARLSLRGFRPEGRTTWRILAIGVPSIVMASVTSVTTFLLNIILGQFTYTAVAVYGVYFKLQSFVNMPLFGLTNALIPIVAFNYGRRDKRRVHGAIRYALLYGGILMFIGLLMFQLFPAQLLLWFDASESMLGIGCRALRIISTSYVFASCCIVMSATCQALGYGVYSLLLSLIRQIGFLIPSAWLLARTGVLDNVWLCYPIAEISAIIVSVIALHHALRKTGMSKNSPEPEETPAAPA